MPENDNAAPAEYKPKPQPETLEKAIAELGLTVESVFVPWSQSRSAKPDPKLSDYNLNWKVTVKRRFHGARTGTVERDILETDYSAGIAHCLTYKRNHAKHGRTVAFFNAIAAECETGKAPRDIFHGPFGLGLGQPTPAPNARDVLYSLALDSDVLDHATFESWASEYGYDPDSRKAESTYRACLEIALKLRAALGDAGLQKLREATEDY